MANVISAPILALLTVGFGGLRAASACLASDDSQGKNRGVFSCSIDSDCLCAFVDDEGKSWSLKDG